jgi:hypothetical protein
MQVWKKIILQVEMAKDVLQCLEQVDNIHFLMVTYDNCKKIKLKMHKSSIDNGYQKKNGD